MKRAAVFAHYDKDKLIDDYVIYYLKKLKEVVDKLVFVSCLELSDFEKSKLDGIVDFIISENHDEYDFGSYKRGYLYLKESLNDYDELIFANDSCYGPLYPLSEVFEKMENEGCDFWGITKNRFGVEKIKDNYVVTKQAHLQSYFLVFNNKVFTSDVFRDFIQSIKHFDIKNDIIINYEIGLTKLLLNSGFSCSAYIKSLYRFNHVFISFWRVLIERYKMPFVKCSVLRGMCCYLTTVENWEKTIEIYTEYPIEKIDSNLKRTRVQPIKKRHLLPIQIRQLFFYFMAIQPGYTKKIFYILVKKYFTFLTD